jgi:exopolysaccharide biosynthesis polyprenyl glycosylphosphotransferase
VTRLLRFLGYRPIVAILDVVIVNVGFILAFLVLWGHIEQPAENVGAYRKLAGVISIAAYLSFQLLDLYGNWLRRSRAHLEYCIVVAIAMTSLLTMASGFFFRQLALPRSVLFVAALIQVALIAGYRLLGRKAYRHWFGRRKTVVVGETLESAEQVAERVATDDDDLYSVELCVSRRDVAESFANLDQAATVVVGEDVKNKDEIILYCFRRHKEVLIVPGISELTAYSAESIGVQDLLIFAVHPHRLGPAESLLKRLVDVLGSLFLLCFASPVVIAAAVVIGATSRGPVFFRQERIGKDRRKFQILKFRTMVADAEKHTGPVLAMDRDPRITPCGRILRALRVDELPQLWNVLRGDMSLVGPRPEREFFVQQFENALPAYELRHSVKPGITGLAQTMAKYSTTVERKLHFDLLYIYSYSFVLDIKILFQTIIVVLRRDQSKGVAALTPLHLSQHFRSQSAYEPGGQLSRRSNDMADGA